VRQPSAFPELVDAVPAHPELERDDRVERRAGERRGRPRPSSRSQRRASSFHAGAEADSARHPRLSSASNAAVSWRVVEGEVGIQLDDHVGSPGARRRPAERLRSVPPAPAASSSSRRNRMRGSRSSSSRLLPGCRPSTPCPRASTGGRVRCASGRPRAGAGCLPVPDRRDDGVGRCNRISAAAASRVRTPASVEGSGSQISSIRIESSACAFPVSPWGAETCSRIRRSDLAAVDELG
jgi:hypothetical protein